MLGLDRSKISALVEEVSAFLFAAECSGCGEPETALCCSCRAAMRPDPVSVRTPDGLMVWAGMRYEGSVARVIRALKQDGQTSLLRVLAPAVRAAAAEAMGRAEYTEKSGHGAFAVAVPTSAASMRSRGYRVPELLARQCELPPLRALRIVQRVADQRGLDRAQRASNVRASMRAKRDGHGLNVLLVDDVITTGATFDEAARALRQAGFTVLAGVAAAATPRHFDTRKVH